MTDERDFEKEHRQKSPLYGAFAKKIADLIEELLRANSIAYTQVDHRAKTTESFLEKIRRKDYADPFTSLKDLAGVRAILYYHDDVGRVAALLRGEFEVDDHHSSDKLEALDVDEFGYRSFHLVAKLDAKRNSLGEWKRYQNLEVEIQVRSVLQHAWAAISHKLDYKSVSQAPSELRRALFRLSALLEVADDQFATLRDRTEIVVAEYQRELSKGELDIELNQDSLSEYFRKRKDLDEWVDIAVKAGMTDPRLKYKEVWSEIGYDVDEWLLKTLTAAGAKTLKDAELLLQASKHTLPELVRRSFTEPAERLAYPDLLMALAVSGISSQPK